MAKKCVCNLRAEKVYGLLDESLADRHRAPILVPRRMPGIPTTQEDNVVKRAAEARIVEVLVASVVWRDEKLAVVLEGSLKS